MKGSQAGPRNIDDYIAGFDRDVRVVLERVRSSIRKAVPAAEETISYRIPAYKLRGQTMIYFAGWKQHYSLYPANARLVAAFKDALEPYEVNNKGTIRFPLDEPVPVKLIAGIAKFRAREAAERATSASPTPAGTKGSRPRRARSSGAPPSGRRSSPSRARG